MIFTKDHVTVHGKRISTHLVPILGHLGIEKGSYTALQITHLDDVELLDIGEIEGLSELTHLKELDLSLNSIEEITDLEQLKNLEMLDLRSNNLKK